MTGSLIHACFDPAPYVLFSSAMIAAGVFIETGRASGHLRSLARDCAGTVARSVQRHAQCIRERAPLHLLKIARR
jgi:hypothetical protein